MDIQQWLTLATQLGNGVTFVLGIVVYKLWQTLQDEQRYCRERDKETLTVLNHLTKVLDEILARMRESHV
jgi:hypothetical protein